MKSQKNLRISRLGITILSICVFACAFFSINTNPAYAATENTVQQRIAELRKLVGKYFTTTGEPCNSSYENNHSCNKCNVNQVIKTKSFRNSSGLTKWPSNYTLSIDHMRYTSSSTNYLSNTQTNGWSCVGFANFAGWYLFADSPSSSVGFYRLIDCRYNEVYKYAKPGDIISSSSHSMIYISGTSSQIKVLDCNYNNAPQCKIQERTMNTSNTLVTVNRAYQYELSDDDQFIEINKVWGSNGHQYILFNGHCTWNQANAYINENFGDSYHLATINSQDEHEIVFNLVQNWNGRGHGGMAWIGARYVDGKWQWVNSEPYGEYSNWANSPTSSSCYGTIMGQTGDVSANTKYTAGKWYAKDYQARQPMSGFVVEYTPSEQNELIYNPHETMSVGETLLPTYNVSTRIPLTDNTIQFTIEQGEGTTIRKDESGGIAAMEPGIALIRLTASDGTTGLLGITVMPYSMYSEIYPLVEDGDDIITSDKNETFFYYLLGPSANADVSTPIWTSSDPSVLRIVSTSSDGGRCEVQAVGNGTATLSVSVDIVMEDGYLNPTETWSATKELTATVGTSKADEYFAICQNNGLRYPTGLTVLTTSGGEISSLPVNPSSDVGKEYGSTYLSNTLPINTSLHVTEIIENHVPGHYWYHVEYGDIDGWFYSNCCDGDVYHIELDSDDCLTYSNFSIPASYAEGDSVDVKGVVSAGKARIRRVNLAFNTDTGSAYNERIDFDEPVSSVDLEDPDIAAFLHFSDLEVGNYYFSFAFDLWAPYVNSNHQLITDWGVQFPAIQEYAFQVVRSPIINKTVTIPSGSFNVKLQALQGIFPEGWYWNYREASQLGSGTQHMITIGSHTTSISNVPCGSTHSDSADYNRYWGAWNGTRMCGFARMLFDLTWNMDTEAACYSYNYKTENDSYLVDYIAPGDMIFTNANGTSRYYFVTGVSGDTITYAACNLDGKCGISWNNQTTKQTILQQMQKSAGQTSIGYICSPTPISFSAYEFTWEPYAVTASTLEFRGTASTNSRITNRFTLSSGDLFYAGTNHTFTNADGVWTYCRSANNQYGWVRLNANNCAPVTASGIPIDADHFPDANFRAYVSEAFDTDGNSMLSDLEIENAEAISISESNVSDLTGIEYFSALKYLDCTDNTLTSLNVSDNALLVTLQCSGNQLTALDVSSNTALAELFCARNSLTSLNVSGCTGLYELSCGTNQLTSLNVSNNTGLMGLYCDNNLLTSLDVSSCTGLLALSCDNNDLTSLDVSLITEMQSLSCAGNHLTSLDVSLITTLTSLDCDNNQKAGLTAENGRFDLTSLPGFDAAKASNWNGGTVTGTVLTVPASGVVTYTYDCGRGFSETFALDVTVEDSCLHENTAWNETEAATCTTAGEKELICVDCGEVLGTEPIPALGHEEVTDEAVAPTCTETGLTEGKHCSRCNTVLVAQETVPALGHEEVTDEAVVPTCTETGLTAGKHCSRCNTVLVAQETVPALGHVEVTDPAVAATCTETGLTAGKHCSRCNAVLMAQNVVPALGHVEVTDAAVAATCTETGLTAGKHCSRCNTVLVAQNTVPALGHVEVTDEAVEPTCMETGLTAGKHCSRCNAVLAAQETVPALGHEEAIDEAVPPTCTETGLTAGKHCSRCEAVLVAQNVVPALGHVEVTDPAVAATCTETGLTAGKHCSRCNTVLVAQETVPALGHEEVTDEAEAPTCTETGLTAGKHCSRCNTVLVAQNVVPALGHVEVTDPAVAATCTETGLTAGKHCSRCEAVLVAQNVVPALGHVEVTDPAVAATCTETGLTAGKHCSRCNAVLTAQETVPALGHEEVTDEAVAPTCTETGLTAGKHCSRCNAVLVAQEIVPALGHTPGAWEIVREATADQEGLKELRCSTCKALLESETIPKPEQPSALNAQLKASATVMGKDGTFTVTLALANNPGIGFMVIQSNAAGQGITLENAETIGTAGGASVTYGTNATVSSTVAITGENGILRLTFKSESKEEATIQFSCSQCFTVDEDIVSVSGTSVQVKVVKRIPGDATDDGVVDGRDVLRLMKYFAGQSVTFNASNADVTGDGTVDGRDVLRLMKYFAGQNVSLQ